MGYGEWTCYQAKLLISTMQYAKNTCQIGMHIRDETPYIELVRANNSISVAAMWRIMSLS